MRSLLHCMVIGTFILLLQGCAALETEVSHHSLKTETKMSKTIFIDPQSIEQKNKEVYLEVKNTSDQPEVTAELKAQLAGDLEAAGWQVVQRPSSKAPYSMQIAILQVGETSKSDAEAALSSGKGGAITGVALAASSKKTFSIRRMVAGGLVGAAAEVGVNSAVKDHIYSMITDIQITEHGTKEKYQTRVVSTADKVNLKFSQARPTLVKDLARAVSGILAS